MQVNGDFFLILFNSELIKQKYALREGYKNQGVYFNDNS